MPCECGCGGEPASGKRFIHNHHNRLRYNTYTERDGGYGTPCWMYESQPSKAGRYPVLCRDGERRAAHRWYYEQAKGLIPEGLQLDHLCCNTLCVNPDHLEVVTAKENIRRAGPKPRRWGDKEVAEVKRLRRQGWSQQRIADSFGVSQVRIGQVLRKYG